MTSSATVEPIIAARRLVKRYGRFVALDGVDVTLYPGEIHVVLGENGAGKSTLVSLLSGALRPDEGEILLRGKSVDLRSPRDGKQAGIEIVHQHFALVPSFTVAENLALASAERSSGMLDVDREASKALEAAADLGWDLTAEEKVGGLGVGEQQRVEIAKALAGGGAAILLDEPTSTLTPGEVQDLFRILRLAKGSGRAIVLITHKLDEALAIADRITVLRKGKVVVTTEAEGIAPAQIARWMVGQTPPELQKRAAPLDGEIVIKASGVTVFGDRGRSAVDGASFTVRKGEIFGIGGVDGNGQLELAEALAGVRPVSGGTLETEQRPAYIPQDRHRDGLALGMSVQDNLLVEGHRLPALRRFGLFLTGAVRAWCETLVAKFQIKTPGLDQPAASLSGGNQQKIVVARALASEPAAIVAMDPTRGLDVQATAYVHRTLLDASRQGAAIVLFSTDLDELAALAGRSAFMSGGRLREGGDVAEMIGGRS